MTWLDRASFSEKMEQDLSSVSITLMASITAGRNISSRDRQEVYLKQSWPLLSLPAPGRCCNVNAATSTTVKWSSRSGRHCEAVRPILWNTQFINIHFEVSRHAVTVISIFQCLMKYFGFVLLCASAGSHLREIKLWVHFPVYFTKERARAHIT